MRIAGLSLLVCLALALAGCLVVHANLPEEFMDDVTVQLDDVHIGSVCSHEGQAYSSGAVVCMGSRRMRCDSASTWQETGSC